MLLLAASGRSAVAQGAEPEGGSDQTRVRITLPAVGRRVGTLLSMNADTVVVRWSHGDTATIALAGVRRLEVSEGRGRRPWLGAGLGFFAGAAAGGVVGATTHRDRTPSESRCGIDFDHCAYDSRSFDTYLGVLTGGGVGVVVGAVAGAMRRTETWRNLPLADPRGRSGLMVPHERGLALGAALWF